MHITCPLSALAPGDAVRPDTSPPIAVFHTEGSELFALVPVPNAVGSRHFGRLPHLHEGSPG